ncbi:phosphotransferase family protein [Sinosporangium siamense]|uniref:Aminoglycoside phosphotransferase n=1 Tax=Sinosporangium siamense TaxID=1367973 RepID=A0A919RGZ9_9ACTN|nr:aminoglycoside phosphotransferase family protein [Sinosporangium siamense]GII93711.1 aminoglycoside phosphotransferase [Sinosporangium siamense]
MPQAPHLAQTPAAPSAATPHDTERHDAAQDNTAQDSTAQDTTAPHGTGQHGAAQVNTAAHNTGQHDALVRRMARLAAEHGGHDAVVVPTRPDVVIVRAGDVVVKAHAPGMEPGPLRMRMRATAAPAMSGVLLPPLSVEVTETHDRLVTVWPAGEPVDQSDPDAAPWEEAARLLAALHSVPAEALPPLPPAHGPRRAAGLVAALTGDGPEERVIRRAFATLPPEARGERPHPRPAVTHGDWHMGQLVRRGDWILIDVDDLGLGDQAWDLARPAAWFAIGLLERSQWERFLGSYLAAGSPALGDGADPWARLDIPARALSAQLAAAAVAKAREQFRPLDEVDALLVDTCARIVSAGGTPP